MRSVFFNQAIKGTMNTKSVGCEAAYQITVTRKEIKKPKRIRSAFTIDQVQFLEEKYKKHPYIDNLHRKEVSKILNITERSIKIWFQNRRMREKQNKKELDFNTLKNSPNGRLSNRPTSTNRTSLPTIMTSDVKSNESNIYKNISVKTESLDNINKESYTHIQEETNSASRKRNNGKSGIPILKSKSPLKQSLYTHSGAYQPSAPKAPLSSSQARPKHSMLGEKQFHYDIPITGVCANRYYHSRYVGSTAIWRPVDMMPVMAKKSVPVLNTVQRTRQVSSACCKCNCHSKRNAGVMKMVPQQKTIYPFSPFMFTSIPFQNSM